MYLKEIITSGFKSFADKIHLQLDDKITCIVGPNGSGKSNVVDAVRWVLGEQSVKSLRGSNSMSDIIFSGSKSRNPLNVASVELVFDNTDHYLNLPYDEISIKRRVYRTGENEYYLNGEKCRLKDVNNLLMDSGMGKESFNIISQGEVERILSNSASDRRIIFEEAAGILKYKKRKEEALNKLERTHSNLDRVTDIINELEIQIGPLEEQSRKAKEYLENKNGLEKYEVALLAYDIKNITNDLNISKEKNAKIEKEILNISTELNKTDAKYLEENTTLMRLEQEKNDLNKKLLSITEEVEKINGEKNLLQERCKNTAKDKELEEKIRTLLEKKGRSESNIKRINEEINIISSEISKIQASGKDTSSKINKFKLEKNMLLNEYSEHEQQIISTKNKINHLRNEIDQGGDLPSSVKSILKSSTLMGIHNTIGNILNIEEKYIKALNIAIASSKNFIITTDEQSAKQAINYLKDNHLGRATFFPMNIIEARRIDNHVLETIKNDPDYISIMSSLVSYDKKYQNIVENQLGMIIVATDIDGATRLSQKLNHKYKIVTLDGDVINVGGSMAGGSFHPSKSTISLKQDLSYLLEKEKTLEEELKDIKEQIETINDENKKLEEIIFNLKSSEVAESEKYSIKYKENEVEQEILDKIENELVDLQAINNDSISLKEKEIIELFHQKTAEKEQIQIHLNELVKELDTRKQLQEEKFAEDKIKNANLKQLEKEKHDLEILINRYDVKIDNMLSTLSEDYELTFEKANADYKLDIEAEEARLKVNSYKNNIKKIGMVNIAAIEDYERVNTRYIFLTNQKEDLIKAEDTLLEIMNDMDEVMKEEFSKTFELIRKEFGMVFKELFSGGYADLKLTNKDDLLTTGIEIEASPPGKKLTSISLLSGGEKTLTAISLLFAILNVRVIPFCLFDEVEAALDEANVDKFGQYLDHYKNKTQFLIITHKKKTMEYANTLYGITMQESGVSKLVSVKLAEKTE